MAYRYNIDFSDAERALIEAYRMKRGHKATATAVRELIAAGWSWFLAEADNREVWVEKNGIFERANQLHGNESFENVARAAFPGDRS